MIPFQAQAQAQALTKSKRHLHTNLLHAAQTRFNALFIQQRVGSADAAAEVRSEVFDGKRRGDEIEGCSGGEAGAVFGEQGECGRPVCGVRGWGREVE